MIRRNEYYIVVTVLKTKNSFELRMRKPKNLAPNQVAIRHSFEIETDDWLNRLLDGQVLKGKPPRPYLANGTPGAIEYGETTSEKVIKRMTGGQ